MFESVEALVAEYVDLEGRLADPGVHGDQAAARKLGLPFGELHRLGPESGIVGKLARGLEVLTGLCPGAIGSHDGP